MGNNKPLLWTAILAAAGTGSAMAQITGTPKAGDYYFKDVATGKFLGAGNKYGTQASLNGGILFTMTIEDGKYILDSKRKREAENHYLSVVDGGNLFVDQGKCGFELVEKSAGQYVIKVGDAYLISEGNVVATGSDEKKAAIWQILPVTDLTKAFTGASFNSPVCATPLIKTPDFSKYIDNKSGWTINDPWNNPGVNTDHDNPCMEFWNRHFKIDQTLNSIPNGLYRLTVQGFDRYSAGQGDATTNVRAKLFANGSSIDMPSVNREPELKNNYGGDITKAPNDMGAASSAFSAGLYKSQPLYVYVDKNTLNIGIEKKEDGGWTIFDNFELAYIGDINVDAVREELTNKLAIQINKAGKYTDDEALQNLAVKAAELQKTINTLVPSNPKAYEIVANYQSGVKGNIGEQIEELGADITKATKNYEAYAAAQKDYKEKLTPKLTELETDCKKVLDDKDTPQDVKDNVKSIYDGIDASVKKFMTDADAAYKAGTAGDSFSDANRKNRVDDLLKAIEDGIGDGSTNALSYIAVNNAIRTDANPAYSLMASDLYYLLAGAKDGDKYEDTYQDALKDLSAVKRAINKIAEENKANYDAQKATAETRDKALADLNVLKAKMSEIYSKYLKMVGTEQNPAEGTLRANYIAANKDIKDNVTGYLITNIKSYFEKKEADKVVAIREEVKTFYSAQITDIENDIKALQANVDAANAAHTIMGTAPFCNKYNEDKTAIIKKVDELKTKVDKSASEFDANANSLAAIKTVETKYNETKGGKKDAFVGVDNQKQDDYTTKGRFAASEKAITDAVAALKAAAANAYKVDGTGTAADFFSKIAGDQQIKEGDKEITLLGTTSIDGKIDAYKMNAVDAFDAYKKVAAALAAYDLALNGKPAKGEEGKDGYEPAEPGLKGTATNTEVTVYGNGTYKGQTYAAAIAAIEKRIKVVSDTLANANKEQDVKHTTGIVGIKLDDTLVGDINKLTNSYKDNEEAWNKAQVAAAKDRLVEEANRYVTTINSSLPEEAYKATEYGKAADMLNDGNGKEGDEELKGYKKLKEEANAIQKKIDEAVAKGDAEAIAVLSEVVKDAKKVNDSVTKLVATAADAKKEFDADQKALATLNGTVSEVRAMLNGGEYNKVKYDGVKKAAGDKDYFTVEISNVNTLINAASAEITTSGTNETVRVDQEDKKEGDKVTKKGYTNRLAEIKTQITNLLSLAANEKANDTALAAFDKALADAKVSDAITAAETALADDKVCTGDGRAFFQVELDKYKAEYTKVSKTDKVAAYGAKVESTLAGALEKNKKYTDTAKNMVANQKSLTDRLNTVKANITGLKALAEANEKAHNDQVLALVGNKDVKGARSQWQEVFDEVANSEQSSAHEAAIKELTEIKKKLDAYETAIADNFAKGTSDTKKADLEKELTAITNKLTQLKNGWGDDYKAAIAADNARRKTDFDNAYTLLLDTYKQKTELVNKLSKLSYASGSNGTLAAITGKNGIFSYIEKIRTLKTEAENSYKETAAPNLWDAEEQYLQKASEFSEDITDLATRYSNEVNNVAFYNKYNEEFSTANSAYTTAKSDIMSTLGLDGKGADAALSDVVTILTNAQNMAQNKDGKFDNPYFAYELDNTILPAFATIIDPKMIAADKENAAVSTWNSTISFANTLATSELAAIQAMGVDKADEGKTYSKPYEEFVKTSIDAAAEEWAKVEEGKKYDNYSAPIALLNDFTDTYRTRNMTPDEEDETKQQWETHTTSYWAAYDAEQERIANDTQYQGMLTKVGELQKAKDAAADFLASLMVMHDADLNSYLQSAQRYIGKAQKEAEKFKTNPDMDMWWYNNCVSQAEEYANRIYDYSFYDYTNWNLVDADAIAKEKAAISLEIGNLYKDYDLAVAQDVTNTELDKYKKSIDEFTEENKKIYDEHTVGIIIGYDEETELPIYETAKDENGNDYNVTTTPVEARDAYVALEKKIGEVKTALTEIGDAAHIDATIASVNEAIAALQTEVDKLNAQLADCHEPVVNKYQSDVDAVAASIDAAKADLQAATDEKTILLYADNIIKTVNSVKDGTSTLADNIKNSEAPFDTNDAKYEKLCGELKKKTDKLQEVYDASLEYEFVQTPYDIYAPNEEGEWVLVKTYENRREYYKTTVSDLIAAEQKKLDDAHKAITEEGTNGLTDNSTVYVGEIESLINDMECNLAYDNQTSTLWAVNSKIYEGLSNYNKVVNKDSERFYPSAEVQWDVYNEYRRLYDLIWSEGGINNYATNAWQYGTTVDLEGNEFKDEEGNVIPEPKTYLEVYPDIMAALAQARKDAEQFEKDSWDKSCLKGDVDNNDNITVNDYNYVRNIIIGELEYDKADPRFLAADVNGDGKINIADVIQMANKIMTGEFVPKTEAAQTRIAALFPEKTEANSLSVVAQGTGSKQFVNISLNDVANFVGAQMDVTLPAGVSLVGATAGAGQEVVFGEVDGVTRLVISNINNDGFAGNDIVTLEVEVSSDYKTGAVIVDNALFSDSRGALYIIGGGASDGATGFTELTAGEKVMNKIYSVGGQIMNSLKKGVNVIINSDGTSRKVNQK